MYQGHAPPNELKMPLGAEIQFWMSNASGRLDTNESWSQDKLGDQSSRHGLRSPSGTTISKICAGSFSVQEQNTELIKALAEILSRNEKKNTAIEIRSRLLQAWKRCQNQARIIPKGQQRKDYFVKQLDLFFEAFDFPTEPEAGYPTAFESRHPYFCRWGQIFLENEPSESYREFFSKNIEGRQAAVASFWNDTLEDEFVPTEVEADDEDISTSFKSELIQSADLEQAAENENAARPTSTNNTRLNSVISSGEFRRVYAKSKARGAGFREFTNGDKIDYFSRDRFENDTGIDTGVSEDKLCELLFEREQPTSLLLCGPGGVGKSRLARYLSQKIATSGVVLEVFKSSKLESIPSIAQEMEQKQTLTFLLDYAESFDREFAERLATFTTEVFEFYGICPNIILCSRVSGEQKVLERFRGYELEIVRLGYDHSRDRHEPGFQNWVVTKILNQFGIEGKLENWVREANIPVIASFAAFLITKSPEQFRKQFSESSINENLKGWFSGRINKMLEVSRTRRVRLSQLVGCLPVDESLVSELFSEVHDDALLQVLCKDRWIEKQSSRYEVAHHLFSDQILDHYIHLNAAGAGTRIRKLLVFGTKNNVLSAIFENLQRLVEVSEGQKIDWLQILGSAIKECEDEAETLVLRFFQSTLFSTEQKVSAIAAIPAVGDGLLCSYDGQALIADLSAEVSSQEQFRNAEFAEVVTKVANDPIFAPRTMPTIFQHNPSKFSSAMLDSINDNKLNLNTANLIQQYLFVTTNFESVRLAIDIWLDRHGGRLLAQKVYWGLYRCGGNIDDHLDQIADWCAVHHQSIYAHRPLQILMEKLPDKERDKTLIIGWLDRWNKKGAAGYIIQKWLTVYKDTNFGKDYLTNWLENYIHLFEQAYFVLKAAKIAGLDLSDYRKFIPKLFNSAPTAKQKLDVCNLWSLWGEEFQTVKPLYCEAFEIDASDPNARFAFESWDEHCNENSLEIKAHLENWISKNSSLPRASHVYNIWIRNQFPFEEIDESLAQWLSNNRDQHSFSKLCEYYLDHSNKNEGFAKELISELKVSVSEISNPLIIKDSYPLQVTMKIDKDPKQIVALCEDWLDKFGSNVDAAFLISASLNRYPLNEKFVSFGMEWLDVHNDRGRAGMMMTSLLNSGVNHFLLREKVMNWMSLHPHHRFAAAIICIWLETGDFSKDVVSYAKRWLNVAELKNYSDAEMVRQKLIRSGLL